MITLDACPFVPITYFTDPPELLRITHFASGATAIGDLRGFSRILYPIGISLLEVDSSAVMAELQQIASLPIQLFVDTGAYSEGKDGEVGEEEWSRRLGLMKTIVGWFGQKAIVVAPDKVGDQGETLRRLTRWREEVIALRDMGARVIVPIQRGALDPHVFAQRAADMLGWDGFVYGLPLKAGMEPWEVHALARACTPHAVHFLGMGPQNPNLVALAHAIWNASPTATITCDSNVLAAHVGRTNGRGGQPRAVTAAERVKGERGREDAVAFAFGPAVMWRRTILTNLLGPAHAYRGTIPGPTLHFGPALPPAPPPAKPSTQLDLFRNSP